MDNEEQKPTVAGLSAPVKQGYPRTKFNKKAFKEQQRFTPESFCRFIEANDGSCFFLTPTVVKVKLKDTLFITESTVARLMATSEFAAAKENYRRSMDDKFWALLSHWVETNLRSKKPSLREGAEILGEVTKQYMKGKTPTKGVSDEAKKQFGDILKKLKTKSA